MSDLSILNSQIVSLKNKIEPLRKDIINHQVYSVIDNPERLRIFMQYHVFAVWDFMSLLKTLQRDLTCTTIPWYPIGTPNTRFLINEIVTGEESDVDMNGIRKSHFELYLEAMKQCGSNTHSIESFIENLKKSGELHSSLLKSGAPKAAINFVKTTFEVIESKKNHVQSAVFTFGREDLIPGMFVNFIKEIHNKFPDEISVFKYYIERHIEIDGGHHSNLALEMTSLLCGDQKELWEEAEEAVIRALQRRKELWDGAYAEICL